VKTRLGKSVERSNRTRSRLKKVDHGSGQVVDPELAVGGAGWSAVA
jgi:hypothetical protein